VGSGTNIGYDGEGSPGSPIQFFEKVAQGRDPKVAANWITQELLAQLARRGDTFDQIPVSAEQLGDLIDLVQEGSLTGTAAKTLLRHIFNHSTPQSTSVNQLANELCLRSRASSDDALRGLCEHAITELAVEANLVREGRMNVLMKIVGKVMKLSQGTADAKLAKAVLLDMLRGTK